MIYTHAPCEQWVVAADLDCDGTADEKALAAQAASDLLFVLSGSQFTGSCSRVSRPGTSQCLCGSWFPYPYRYGSSDTSSDWLSSWHMRGQDCIVPWRVKLGWYPVTSIQSVVVDGVTLNGSEYRVEDFNTLVRVDKSYWPWDDIWQVNLTAGEAIPAMGKIAAKKLACELVLAQAGDSACKLPDRTQSFVRAGLSVNLQQGALGSKDLTGIFAVQLFLSTYNPQGLAGDAIVAVPGALPHTHERI